MTMQGRRRVSWAWVLAIVLIGHAVALYMPGSPQPTLVETTGLDKLVHMALFGVPAYVICRMTGTRWPLWLLMVHAPVSEVIQYTVVPYRSGDPLDIVADLIGVAIGYWLGTRAESKHVQSA